MATTKRPLLLIAGIGEGLGLKLAHSFAVGGHDVVGLARRAEPPAGVAEAVAASGGHYRHFVADLADPAAVSQVLRPLAPSVDVLVYNAQRLQIATVGEIEPETFEAVWRDGCFGAFLVARALLPVMAARGGGTAIFSGATASRRGGARFSAFASAKFGLRGLVQALAREFGPAGIHVTHVVIDGLIAAPQTERRFGPAEGPRLDPAAVAAAYLALARQPASAWTQELDLRSGSERY
ncbi:SDR family NAD(P)-dependent oxidoreductase [Bosea sp. (in: a-proteobacteria)]|jgi:NAD(P)-dependent dehydrogenase (short-subunit alcohol dehydrogenase family)|uniref:SDR family NAD(P)-dependent oxidoreductase n=1 Tax=Bosea sp. (in: a-proteobacteria) TaxID=1871050 RepID=UPI003569369E